MARIAELAGRAACCSCLFLSNFGRRWPMTLGGMLWSLRVCDEISQAEFARRLGVSRSHLCDVEKGRKVVSPERAAAWAEILGFPPTVFVKYGSVDADCCGR